MRQIDFSAAALTVSSIHAAIDLVDTELLAVEANAPAPARQVDFATQAHNGVGWNSEIDRLHARITAAANLRGKPVPPNAARLFDHRTGNHDSSRIHQDLDRLHARVDRLRHERGYTVTKATDNTHAGVWPGPSLGSLAGCTQPLPATPILRLDVIAGDPFAYRWSYAGTQDAETFSGWMGNTTIVIDAGSFGILTFTVPLGSTPPGTTIGQFWEDIVTVAY